MSHISMLLLTESTLWFINMLVSDYESNRRKSLSGNVKNWATNVHEKSLLRGSANAMPNPSASSALSSWSTKLNTLATSTSSSTQHSIASDTGIMTKFGGFDLNSDEEKETAPFKNREGKPNKHIALVVHSNVDSNVKIEDSEPEIEDVGSQIPPWWTFKSIPNSDVEFEASQTLPRWSPQARVSSAGKRKIEETALDNTNHNIVSITAIENTQPVTKKTHTGGTKPKSRSDYKNSHLPVPADYKWTNAFMDTVILWAGGQLNIWSIPDETLAAALQEIFTTVDPDIQYEAWQRLLKWHSGFGSIALVMVIHFFLGVLRGNPDLEDSNAMVHDLAGHFISPPHFPFTHEDSAQLSKTISSVDIQSLETAKLKKGYGMECVIALAAAVLKRAFTLVRDGVIDIQDAVKEMAEKKGKITLPKMLNKATGNMSKGTSMFSMGDWGSETQSYAILVTKKGPENTANIITSAYAQLDHRLTGSSPSDTDTVDPHALLWYFSQKLGPTDNFLDLIQLFIWLSKSKSPLAVLSPARF
ncbi:hypothetical protein BS17DRAFT_817050 [Gyrodon lividus]|nr:hypothetical protein BS17DRAFT_817050 [Gyrodon lividus]